NTLADATGNGHTATSSGATYTATGKINGAYAFDGNDVLIVSNDVQLDFDDTESFWLNSWVKVTAIGADQDVIGRRNTGNNPEAWSMLVSSTGRVRGYIAQNADYVITPDTGSTVSAGSFHMGTVVFDRDNDRLLVYLDRTLTHNESLLSTIDPSSTADIYIGARHYDSTTDHYLTGTIDEPAVFTGVPTQEQIDTLYNSGAGEQYPFPPETNSETNFTVTAKDAYNSTAIQTFNATVTETGSLSPDSTTGTVDTRYLWNSPPKTDITERFGIVANGTGSTFAVLALCQAQNPIDIIVYDNGNVKCYDGIGYDTLGTVAASPTLSNPRLGSGTVVSGFYNTTTGTATTDILNNATVLYDVTVAANNYFTSSTAAHNTTASLDQTLTPWTAIRAELYNGTAVNNFTAEYDSAEYATTTGVAFIPLFNETATVSITAATLPSGTLVNTSANLTADPYLQNHTFTLFYVNSLNITFRDLDTQNLINNVTLLAEGNSATYNLNTTTGNIFAELLNPNTYKLTATSSGYADNTIYVTLNNDNQTVTMYLQNDTSDIIVIVRDTLGDDVSQATITIGRNINGSTVTYAQAKTDFSGSTTINLVNGVDYTITVTHPSYAVFADTITPISGLSPYTIRLRALAEEVFVSPLTGIYYKISTDGDAAKTWFSVTYDITSEQSDLQWFSANTTYDGVIYTQNVSGSPAGGIITLNITNLNITAQNVFTVQYAFKASGFDTRTWTETYYISPYVPGAYTVQKNLLSAAGELGVVGRAILGTLIVLAFISIVGGATKSITIAGVAGLAGVGLVYYGGLFIPIYASIAAVFSGTLILADNLLRGRGGGSA
ncbi:MAG: LamG domain-containing protein, partial [Actinobacteria bacterium]|nr:LamG domain-containing protein [Actinomycetota bacterium]